MNSKLQQLLVRPDVWQASHNRPSNSAPDTLPTGHATLDAALHQGGWPCAALIEVLGNTAGIGEMQLLLPALVQCSRGARRLFVVCPPHLPYAPALQAHGVRLDQLLILSPSHPRDVLWSVEQILRSGTCACLLAWLSDTRATVYRDLRRLQLAAHRSGSLVFLFRPARAAASSSPASLRLLLGATSRELILTILKQRGGWPGQRIALPRPPELLQEHILATMLPATISGERVDTPSDPTPALQWNSRVPREAVALH